MEKIFIPRHERPRCQIAGCKGHGQHLGNYRKDGTPLFRNICARHHLSKVHPYLKYRQDYCKNKNGFLGFVCRYKIRDQSQLEVDHINGNPYDNRFENLQTLCANCHRYKTIKNKDNETPGRQTLKNKNAAGVFQCYREYEI